MEHPPADHLLRVLFFEVLVFLKILPPPGGRPFKKSAGFLPGKKTMIFDSQSSPELNEQSYVLPPRCPFSHQRPLQYVLMKASDHYQEAGLRVIRRKPLKHSYFKKRCPLEHFNSSLRLGPIMKTLQRKVFGSIRGYDSHETIIIGLIPHLLEGHFLPILDRDPF